MYKYSLINVSKSAPQMCFTKFLVGISLFQSRYAIIPTSLFLLPDVIQLGLWFCYIKDAIYKMLCINHFAGLLTGASLASLQEVSCCFENSQIKLLIARTRITNKCCQLHYLPNEPPS